MSDASTAVATKQKQAKSGVLSRAIVGCAEWLLDFKPAGSLIVQLPDGRALRFGAGDQDAAVLVLRNFRVVAKAMRSGAIGFAEAYMDGDIDSPDLTTLFRFFLRNREKLNASGRGLFRSRSADRIRHLLRRNSRRGSRANIVEHYDLGNDFFLQWLSADGFYSSGYFERDGATLEEAQVAKARLVLEALELNPGHSLLEIGSGWGELSLRAARDHGAQALGITLSDEQLEAARQRAANAGLAAHCRFALQDYRDVAGCYDRIASIEMVEAVGEENWQRYFDILHDRLKPGGVAVIQAITIAERLFPQYRRKADFIQRHIFPGGMLPTAGAIRHHAMRSGLTFTPVRQFGSSYARTLREWRSRFEANWPAIAELGFDARFRRKWRYYLAYCEAGFIEGAIDVGVYRLEKPAVSGA